MDSKQVKELLAVAQEGKIENFTKALSTFFKHHALGDFGQVTYRKSGDAILHVLARNGHVACFRFVTQEFAGNKFVDLEIRNLDGKTPLHEAAQHGQHILVDELLQAGAKVNQLKRADWSPIMLAVTHPGRVTILKSLLDAGADIDIMNKDGWGVFHIAARTGDLDMLNCILEKDPTAWNTVSKNGRTPLHTAALAGSFATVNLLIAVGANINSVDGCGSTPMMDAVRSNDQQTLTAILSCDGLDREIVDKMGRNPVHIAAGAGCIAALKSLKQAGFKLESLTARGQSALHCAAREGQADTVSWLLEQGLAVNSVEENGRSPLFLAVSGQHTETARRLIHKGAENVSDSSRVALVELARKEELKRILTQAFGI